MATIVRKARLSLYLEDEEMKRRINIAAAREGMSTTAYCSQAIRERLIREGEISERADEKKALLARVEELRQQIGPVGAPAAELVREGRIQDGAGPEISGQG